MTKMQTEARQMLVVRQKRPCRAKKTTFKAQGIEMHSSTIHDKHERMVDEL